MDKMEARAIELLTGCWDEEEQGDVTRDALEAFHATKHLCESPIEVLMLAGLISIGFGYADKLNAVVPYDAVERINAAALKRHVIVPQMVIPQFNYRADFFISLDTNGSKRIGLFVECDGHDYHEKTKEQAARDRKRDRDLQSLGMNILRFTGSEIYNDFNRCLVELDLFGCNLIENEWAAAGMIVPGFLDRQRRRSI